MKLSIKKIFTATILALSTLSLSGCVLALLGVGVVGGAGTVAYVEGKYQENLEANVQKTYNAALKAIQDNSNYVLVKKEVSPSYAKIEAAAQTDQTDFYVEIKSLTSNASQVTIKFGTFGDKGRSAELMTNIQKNL